MSDPTQPLDRRSFLRRSAGLALLLPTAGALATLAGCGDGGSGSAPAPGAPPAPAPPPAPPKAATPAAPAPSAAAPAPPPAAAPDPNVLVTGIPAQAAAVTALQYVNESPLADQKCEGCQLYTAGSGGKGKCALFPQGLVSARGHCTSWVKKVA